MRILAVDPGDKRIGVAISDPSGTIAGPLARLAHVARQVDAAAIASLAAEHEAGLIVVGKSLDEDGQPTGRSRSADRLVEAIRQQCAIPVTTWDESFSTQEARRARIEMGARRFRRGGHLDELAAVVILQSYLDSR